MNSSDVRKLLGGYATGSLTEAERQRLFDAALEDQELFDQIAGEHALKEILEEPGARARLLAALEPKTRWWLKPWPRAAGAAALLSLVAIVVVSNRTAPPPQQVAQVMKTELPAPPSVQEPAKPSPPAAPARKKAAPPQPKAPLPEMGMERMGEARVDEFARGGRRPDAPRAAVAGSMAFKAPPAFSLQYNVGRDGFLEVTPSATGFLSVTANVGVVFPNRSVAAGTPVRIPIPADAVDLVVGFSAVTGITGAPVMLTDAFGTVADQDPPNGRILVKIPARP